MICEKIKYAFDDVSMIPAVQSTIDSRKECNPFDENGMLPLITSPMYSVVDERNVQFFIDNGIYGIYPRTCQGADIPNSFRAYGLEEFIQEFLVIGKPKDSKYRVLIDMANGHMIKLTETVAKAKKEYGNSLSLMVGNIANPDTYTVLSEAGADFVRLSIGTGNTCTTSINSSIHWPLASLIDECRERKSEYTAKIIADGGLRNFDDIIKAIGLGADYCMCGSIFNKALESAGRTWMNVYDGDTKEEVLIDQFSPDIKSRFERKTIKLKKEYYGMSTKRAQKEMGNAVIKTSEGIVKFQDVEYTLCQWRENFIHYLTTAMSYTGKRTLKQFIGNVEFGVITRSAREAYYK